MRHARIIVPRYGGPDELRVVEEERPEPKQGEVRVRLLAAGVAYPDLLMREGLHPEKPPLPFTPGWDLIGVVDRLGKGVSGIEPGQIIAALPISGAYAEFVCLPQRELVPLSRNRHLRVVHRWRLASPGPETAGPLQHPVAQTAETGIVSTGSDRPL